MNAEGRARERRLARRRTLQLLTERRLAQVSATTARVPISTRVAQVSASGTGQMPDRLLDAAGAGADHEVRQHADPATVILPRQATRLDVLDGVQST